MGPSSSGPRLHAPPRTPLPSPPAWPPPWAVGPWHDREFALLRDELDPPQSWPVAASLEALLDDIQQQTPPPVVLLAQQRCGELSQGSVERLRAAAPLARIIVVAGSWCEGELRTGKPLAGVVRLYWHELPAWWRAAAAARVRGASPPWSEPLDDLRSGYCVSGAATGNPAAGPMPPDRGAIVIDTRDLAAFESLSAAVAHAGWSCHWRQRQKSATAQCDRQPPPRVDLGVWDGGQLGADELQQLNDFCRRPPVGRAPVLALLDYPRPEHGSLARAAGATAILGKPYQTALLIDELARLAAARP
ncbi:MAG: hypothetical protein IT424_01300 [Pirellulales bacterium]|nr:hypothetical protein [Pirellulales bacterium]